MNAIVISMWPVINTFPCGLHAKEVTGDNWWQLSSNGQLSILYGQLTPLICIGESVSPKTWVLLSPVQVSILERGWAALFAY